MHSENTDHWTENRAVMSYQRGHCGGHSDQSTEFRCHSSCSLLSFTKLQLGIIHHVSHAALASMRIVKPLIHSHTPSRSFRIDRTAIYLFKSHEVESMNWIMRTIFNCYIEQLMIDDEY